MASLPGALGGRDLEAWRLDAAVHAAGWDSGVGAERYGGRWNVRGQRAVYCSIDPATALLEVAVHKGFRVLDTTAHVLTGLAVADPASVHVVPPEVVPNPAWLQPGIPSFGQQRFGSELLARHGIVVFPSAVSRHSWNLVFEPQVARGRYALKAQERFAMDTRLHPPDS
jgi:RES domain-containing protein